MTDLSRHPVNVEAIAYVDLAAAALEAITLKSVEFSDKRKLFDELRERVGNILENLNKDADENGDVTYAAMTEALTAIIPADEAEFNEFIARHQSVFAKNASRKHKSIAANAAKAVKCVLFESYDLEEVVKAAAAAKAAEEAAAAAQAAQTEEAAPAAAAAEAVEALPAQAPQSTEAEALNEAPAQDGAASDYGHDRAQQAFKEGKSIDQTAAELQIEVDAASRALLKFSSPEYRQATCDELVAMGCDRDRVIQGLNDLVDSTMTKIISLIRVINSLKLRMAENDLTVAQTMYDDACNVRDELKELLNVHEQHRMHDVVFAASAAQFIKNNMEKITEALCRARDDDDHPEFTNRPIDVSMLYSIACGYREHVNDRSRFTGRDSTDELLKDCYSVIMDRVEKAVYTEYKQGGWMPVFQRMMVLVDVYAYNIYGIDKTTDRYIECLERDTLNGALALTDYTNNYIEKLVALDKQYFKAQDDVLDAWACLTEAENYIESLKARIRTAA